MLECVLAVLGEFRAEIVGDEIDLLEDGVHHRAEGSRPRQVSEGASRWRHPVIGHGDGFVEPTEDGEVLVDEVGESLRDRRERPSAPHMS